MHHFKPQLRRAAGGEIRDIAGGWRLSIPAGEAGTYRLAQLDDYGGLGRSSFPHQAPTGLVLSARASAAELPGTWGFGLWNDPLGMSLGFGGGQKLPTLPDAAWFFFASPENYLALRAGLPGSGALAAVYRAPRWPALLALGLPALPGLLWPPVSRALRRAASRLLPQDALQVEVDPRDWQHYRLEWQAGEVEFAVNGDRVFRSPVAPRGPLGLVLWLDNQYAAWRPDGRLGYGTLANPAAWIEIRDLQVN